MAAGDFWRRLAYDVPNESEGLQPLNPFELIQVARDVIIPAPGGINLATARQMLKVDVDVDQLAEFDDLVATVANITNATAITQRFLRYEAIEAVFGLGHIAQRHPNDTPSNPYYHDPEAVWQRARDVFGDSEFAGAGGLVGTMAAAQWPGAGA